MKKRFKRTYSVAACVLSIALAISMLSGCSNKGIGVSTGKDNKATTTPSTETTPTQGNTPTPTEGTDVTPTDGATATPTDGVTSTPTNGTTATTATTSPSKATTPTPTKKATSTPAPTISQSDKGTSTVVENGSAPVSTNVTPQASGTEVYGGATQDKAAIDASHKSDGYIMVKYLGDGSKIKLRITVPGGTVYTYNLNSAGNYETFPLSGGNGSYTVKVYKNVSGTKYATEYSETIDVSLKDQFAPFLHSNQYVNYSSSSRAVAVGKQVTSGCSSTLDKVQKVYTYVATNISYDYNKANSVSSGYLPNIDSVLSSRKGICFDYAALMTAMLRSQNIPTKLVVGYAGSAYHAWISVYVSGEGWIDGVIYFDGKSWEVMDPTFASTQGSEAIKNTTYSAKYLY